MVTAWLRRGQAHSLRAVVWGGGRTRAGHLERSSLSVPRDAPAWNGAALALQRQGASGPIGPLPATQALPKSAFA